MASRAVSRHYEACLAPTGTTTTQYSILRYLQRNGPTQLRPLYEQLQQAFDLIRVLPDIRGRPIAMRS